MGGDIRLTARARGEPPMMDLGFVPSLALDQSLALEGSQSEFWCIKPCHICCLWRLLPGACAAGWRISSGEFRPGTQTPNKALYCLILWPIGFILGGA